MSPASRLLARLRRARPFPLPSSPLLLAGLLVGAAGRWLTGCDDVSCVFTTGCQGGEAGPGPIGTSAATLPVDGQEIATGPPVLLDVFPNGGEVAGTTPVVLTFGESLSAATVAGAFQITTGIGGAVPGVSAFLVGQGRVVVLLPQNQLPPDDYFVRFAGNAPVTDLTGQELESTGDLAAFTVVSPSPAGPSLVATWPPDGARNVGQTTSVVAVFDRALATNSVTQDSFSVTVDGADPVPDPDPGFLSTGTGTDPRVVLWRSQDAAGTPAFLGDSATVELALSTGAARITGATGGTLPATRVEFDTAAFRQPLSAGILSNPPDAIGIANLEPGPEAISIQVDLEDGRDGDFVDVFVFGNDPAQTMQPLLLAFQRTVQLSGTEPIVAGTFSRSELDLLAGSGATTARVADGAVSFAFRLRRGGVASPLTLLDVDPASPGIQDPLLDTVRPRLLDLANPGGTSSFRSDQRGLVLVGTASELVSAVEVQSAAGDNLLMGALAPAVGSNEAGQFVAAPVGSELFPAGLIDYEVVVYDAALNPSSSFPGSFRQVGVVGPEPFVPGDTVRVEVFDAVTLEAVEGALAISHADMGDGTYPFTASAMTNVGGRTNLATAAGGAVGALVTVDAAGYDLFTFQGVTSTRLSVGLVPTGSGASATVRGSVGVDGQLSSLFALGLVDLELADSRRPPSVQRTFAGGACTGLVGTVICPIPPEPVRPGVLGVLSVLAGSFEVGDPTNPGSFDADSFLQGFELCVPRPALVPGSSDQAAPRIPFLFSEPGVPASEQPEAAPATVLDATGIAGLDTTMLAAGSPEVTMETLVPGVGDPVVVGLGFAFEDVPGDTWELRAASPGAVTGGFFATSGVVDPDLFQRAELRDADGNRSVRRARLSQLGGLPVASTLQPVDVPALLVPAPGGSAGGRSYDLSFEDVLPDALGMDGLHRVRLEDSAGRGWTLWTPDPADAAAGVGVHVPDLAPGGGSGLADGTIRCELALFAASGLDRQAFLWSDLEREHELFVRAAEVTFSQP